MKFPKPSELPTLSRDPMPPAGHPDGCIVEVVTTFARDIIEAHPDMLTHALTGLKHRVGDVLADRLFRDGFIHAELSENTATDPSPRHEAVHRYRVAFKERIIERVIMGLRHLFLDDLDTDELIKKAKQALERE